MAKANQATAQQGAGIGLNASTTYYFAPCTGIGSATAVTEANAKMMWREAGTLADLFAYVPTNNRGATTVASRKNAGAGNQALSIGASGTGYFYDNSNTDTIASGDFVAIEYIIGAGGTIHTLHCVSMTFINSNASETSQLGGVSLSNSQSAAATRYSGFYTGSPVGGTEAEFRLKLHRTARFKNMFVRVSSNTWTSTTTFNIRKNSAAGAQSVAVATTLTGDFEDTTNIDTMVSGDFFTRQLILAAGSGAIVWHIWSTEMLISGTISVLMNGGSVFQSANLVRYGYCLGHVTSVDATESNVQSKIYATAGYTNKMRCYIAVNTVTAASTMQTRKNTANGNLLLSITASTTGLFEDLVNFDTITAGDIYNYIITTGATGTQIGYRNIACDLVGNQTVNPTLPMGAGMAGAAHY